MNESLPFIRSALIDCEQALDQPEKWFVSCSVLSNIFAKSGNSHSAYLWQTLAQQSQPSPLIYHVQAGHIYANFKHWDQAILHNLKALKIDRKLAIAHFNLSQLYQRIGKRDISLKFFYRFMLLRPDQVQAEQCEVLGKAMIKQGEIKRAVTCYRRAIRNDPQRWNCYYQLAGLLQHQGQQSAALACYRRLLKQDPTQAEAHQLLGIALLEDQQLSQAEDHFRQAVQHKPDFVWAYQTWVKSLMALQQWDEAIQACDAAIQIPNQTIPWAYRNKAKALAAKGKQAETISCHQNLAALAGWPEAKQKDYHFTYDLLTHQLDQWRDLLQSLRASRSKTSPLHCIEVGVGQGMRSCWLLDQYLTHAQDSLTCVDASFAPRFQNNLAKSRPSSSVTQLQGEIKPILQALQANRYNLIILQQQPPSDTQTLENALASWPLLKPGGILVLINGWNNAQPLPTSLAEEGIVLHQDKQLWLQKSVPVR